MIGRTLGHYHIRAKLGSGGMGDVYRAHDLTLDRDIALKTLPPELADNDSLRARFEREAKAIAALNHPNIVTVHSVEEVDGVHFITMELVKGTTLAALMPRQGLPLDTFFDISVALADAVAAAHAQGIVHRDLKPGNVMIDPEGRVKVLDFGLAKASDRLAETGAASNLLTAAQTEQGVIVGTCKYMSPEQARGEAVDARSDIFSLGIVFYEMLTGRPPFEGTTPSDVISSIIKDVPPSISEVRSGIPRELSRMVRRCLSKDVSKRAQSALDIRNELSELRRELESGELLGTPQPARNTRLTFRNVGLLLAAVFGLFLLVLVGLLKSTKPLQVIVPRVENPVQVTSAAGLENHPTWSPDGGRIAYDSDQSGNDDIWVTQPTGGPAINLTADHNGFDSEPAWSPDGNQIAFGSARDGGGIYVMPAIGGPSTRMSPRASTDVNSPAWSSDGAELAYLAVSSEATFIEIVTVKTRESRRLQIPGEPGGRFDLSWSPDRRFFAFVRSPNDASGATRIWVLRASDAQATAITEGMSADWSPKWSKDGRTLFFISNRKGSMDLWQQHISKDGRPEGEAVPITVGIGMQRAAFTSDGRKLAYSKGRPVANVWRVPIREDREAVWADAKQLTFDSARIVDLDVLPDGEHLLVDSDRGGIQSIWSLPIHGNDPRQITSDRAPDSGPRVSPDGKQIAFFSYRSGNRKIWVIPSDGGPAVQLTTDDGADQYPSWSPDSRNIVFASGKVGGSHIFVVPATGGEVRQVTTGSAWDLYPQWSPDGQRLLFTSNRDDGIYRLWWVPFSGGPPQRLTQGPAYLFRWSPDGKRIYFEPPWNPPRTAQLRAVGDVWELTLADGKERQVTRLSGNGGMGHMAVGEHDLYFTWEIYLGDIWVMDVVTPKNE
jgi:Tol biopolymer transport system component